MGIRRSVGHHSSGGKPTAQAAEFERLVNAYYRPLYQFALSLTHDEAEASDMTQQTFYIWAARGYQLRDGSKAKTWLFTTLHREFLQTRRGQRRFLHYPLDEVSDELPCISPATGDRLDALSVLQALRQLHDSYQAPLVLFYLGEHSYKEIAEILDLPIGTVQSRIARGKMQLQRMVSGGAVSAMSASAAVDQK
jgi:RNA polymerase sigma factor (sigma-70 family)